MEGRTGPVSLPGCGTTAPAQAGAVPALLLGSQLCAAATPAMARMGPGAGVSP